VHGCDSFLQSWNGRIGNIMHPFAQLFLNWNTFIFIDLFCYCLRHIIKSVLDPLWGTLSYTLRDALINTWKYFKTQFEEFCETPFEVDMRHTLIKTLINTLRHFKVHFETLQDTLWDTSRYTLRNTSKYTLRHFKTLWDSLWDIG